MYEITAAKSYENKRGEKKHIYEKKTSNANDFPVQRKMKFEGLRRFSFNNATIQRKQDESYSFNNKNIQFIRPYSIRGKKGEFVGDSKAVHIHIVGKNTHVKNSRDGKGARTNFQKNIDGYRLAYSIINESGWLHFDGGPECVGWLLEQAQRLGENIVKRHSNLSLWQTKYPGVDPGIYSVSLD